MTPSTNLLFDQPMTSISRSKSLSDLIDSSNSNRHQLEEPRYKRHHHTSRLIVLHYTLPYSFYLTAGNKDRHHRQGNGDSPNSNFPVLSPSLSNSTLSNSTTNSLGSLSTVSSVQSMTRLVSSLASLERQKSSLNAQQQQHYHHRIRPSICNLLDLREGNNIPKVESTALSASVESLASAIEQGLLLNDASLYWEFEERLNHPALMVSNAESVDTKLFIGWPGQYIDHQGNHVDLTSAQKSSLLEAYRRHHCHPVFLDNQRAQNAFVGYYRTLLWPLMYYALKELPMLEAVLAQEQYWQDMLAMSRHFAQAVARLYERGDQVLVVGVQLALVPELLRQALPDDASIGFYLTDPFPSSEVYRCCPQAKDLLLGMLGARVCGFQDYSYVSHFLSSCARVLGVEHNPTNIEVDNRTTYLTVLPMGADCRRILRKYLHEECFINSPSCCKGEDERTLMGNRSLECFAVKERIASLQETYAGKTLIVGIDKTEQARGVRRKLEGYQRFLSQNPDWIGKIVMLQVMIPDVVFDGSAESRLSELAIAINCQFGSLEYTPVHLLTQLISPAEYYGLLAAADLFMITPERDAMPLTPLEWTLCQEWSGKKSPLIVSEFMIFGQRIKQQQKFDRKEGQQDVEDSPKMMSAFVVNPWDYEAISQAINTALTLTLDQRHAMHDRALEYVKRTDTAKWADGMLFDMRKYSGQDELSASRRLMEATHTPLLDLGSLKQAYQTNNGQLRYFFLDYDGTLVPIKKTPAEAKPSHDVIQTLTKLTADPLNRVYVVSGRDRDTLDKWLGQIPRLGLSAEHGCFLKEIHEDANLGKSNAHVEEAFASWKPCNQACLDNSWQAALLPVLEYFTERTPGTTIERKSAALVWHYRLATDPDFGEFMARECLGHLESTLSNIVSDGAQQLEVTTGKKIIEIKPRGTTKGTLITKLLEGIENTYSSSRASQFVFCAGDDRTDEDMFRAINELLIKQHENTSTNSMTTCFVGPWTRKSVARVRVDGPHALLAVLTALVE